MGRSPYSSAELGPLMRNVKNAVCGRLSMEGLIEDDFGMELLVAGRIIDLSLPVDLVYEAVWRPHLAGRGGAAPGGAASPAGGAGAAPGGRSPGARSPGAAAAAEGPPPADRPMVVTYRLSGLDGEATEDVVKQLAPPPPAAGDEEREFAASAVCAETLAAGSAAAPPPPPHAGAAAAAAAAAGVTGMHVLLAMLTDGERPRLAAAALPELLRVVSAACRLPACRRALLRAGAVRRLVQLVHRVLQPLPAEPLASRMSRAGSLPGGGGDGGAAAPSAGGAVAAAAAAPRLGCGMTPDGLLALLKLLESLAAEANSAGGEEAAAGAAGSPAAASSAEEVRRLADGLGRLDQQGLQDAAAVLARVLFALAAGNVQAQAGLLDHHAPSLDLAALDAADEATAAAQRVQLQSFIRLAEGLSGGAPPPPPPGSPSPAASPASPAAAPAATPAAAPAAADKFKALTLERGVPTRVAAYLVGAFALPGGGGGSDGGAGGAAGGAEPPAPALCAPSSAQWAGATAAAGVPLALQLLAALVAGHGPTARAVAGTPGLLDLLHQLEGASPLPAAAAAARAPWAGGGRRLTWVVVGRRRAASLPHTDRRRCCSAPCSSPPPRAGPRGGAVLGPLAEGVLQAASAAGGAAIAGRISALREASKAAARALALAKRESMLKSMGMLQARAAPPPAAPPASGAPCPPGRPAARERGRESSTGEHRRVDH